MRRAIFAVLVLVTIFAGKGYSQLVAEQVTKDNAAARLFSGSDANGGIGDWYLSNGIVEAIIDNAAFSPDLAAIGANRPIQNGVAPTGGNLIDLALVGKNNDQFNQMFQVANLSPNNAFFYLSVSAAVTSGLATVTAKGILLFDPISTLNAPTLQAQTVYSLAPGDRFLTITTTIINTNETDVPVFNVTDAIPLIGRTLLPFVPFPGRGFNNPQLALTPEGIAAALGIYPFVILPGNIRPADGVMDTVTGTTCGEISYGLVPVSVAINSNVTPLQALLGVNSDLVSASGNPFDPAKAPMLPAGGTFTYTRRIFVGDRNDVSSVTNVLYSGLFPPAAVGTLTGDIDAEDNADVEANLIFEGKLPPVFGDKTLPVTQVRTDSTGKFSVVLPAGEYTVSIASPERDDLTNVKVTVAPGTTTVATIPKSGAVGTISFTVTEKGSPVPAKLTFLGQEGTPNPNFSRFFDAAIFDPMTGAPIADLLASSYTGGPAINFLFNTDGAGKQTIKPGKYEVIASRGPEYTVSIKTVTVTAGQEAKLDFTLERVVDTTGFVSADFHVHSGKSFDASAPLEDRIRSYVAEGVEVIVATDHNYITDYAPIIQKLGLGRFAKSIVGDELTTSLPNPLFPQAFGHHNAFPLLVDPFAPRHGAPNTEYVPAATFYDRVKMNNPGVDKVIQLNHPRSGVAGLTLIGLFNIINFNPTKPIPLSLLVASPLTGKTRNIDFDSMEIYNGPKVGEFQQVRNDWFSLLDQGFFKTATAVADSHRVVLETPGFPRSYVATPTDDPSAITDKMITDAVLPDKSTGALTGKVIGTSGPFIRFDIDGQPIGSLIKKTKGKVTLNITVTAPAWVPVDEVRILANGKQVISFDATTKLGVTPAPSDPTSNQGVERFKASIKLKPKGDTYYTVEAGVKLPDAKDLDGDGVIDTGDTNGDGKIDGNDHGLVQPPSPPIYAAIAPGFVPLAFTNPIFIDRNGNGKFDPPGLGAIKVLTAERPIQIEPESNEKSYFPWYQLRVGKEEMKKFFELLTGPELRLAQPIQK